MTQPLRRNRDFVLLQTGQLLSTAGTGSTAIAFPLLVLAVTHSPAKAGLVSFARLLPFVVFGLPAGVAADRWNRKRLMLGADLVRVFAVGSLVAAILLDRLAFAHIAIVGFVEGAAYLLFDVAEAGALRSVVPTAQLPAAASAEQARESVVRLASPPLGGALFGLGRVVPFAVDVASYVFSFASLLAIRTPFQEEREGEPGRLRTQVAEGFRFLWSRPFLRATALLIAVGNFVGAGIQLAVVVLAQRHGLSSGAIGGLVAAVGASTLLGSIVSPLLRRVLSLRLILLSEFWAALGTVSFLVWPSVYVLAGAFAAQAFFFPNTDAAVNSYRFAVTPDRLLGRVNAVSRNLRVLAMPLGPLAAGVLLDALSPRAAVGVFVGCAVALALIGTLSPSIRRAPDLDEALELGASRA